MSMRVDQSAAAPSPTSASASPAGTRRRLSEVRLVSGHGHGEPAGRPPGEHAHKVSALQMEADQPGADETRCPCDADFHHMSAQP